VLPSPIFMILAQKMWPQLKKAYDESHMPLPLYFLSVKRDKFPLAITLLKNSWPTATGMAP